MKIRWHGGLVSTGFIAGGVLLAMLGSAWGAGVTFAWTPNTDIVAGYKIHYGPASRTYNQLFDARNVTSGTVSNLVPGTRYFFALTAYNSQGLESDYSNEITYFVPTNTAPSGPFRLTIALTPSRQRVLTLTGPTNRNYSIETGTNLTAWMNLGTVSVGPAGSASLVDTNPPAQPRRYYRARAL
jgi:hypothetical protein